MASGKRGTSAYSPVFVSWFEIERYTMPVKNPVEFIKSWSDYENWLWEQGATIEEINSTVTINYRRVMMTGA
jgi:hypothetical protein